MTRCEGVKPMKSVKSKWRSLLCLRFKNIHTLSLLKYRIRKQSLVHLLSWPGLARKAKTAKYLSKPKQSYCSNCSAEPLNFKYLPSQFFFFLSFSEFRVSVCRLKLVWRGGSDVAAGSKWLNEFVFGITIFHLWVFFCSREGQFLQPDFPCLSYSWLRIWECGTFPAPFSFPSRRPKWDVNSSARSESPPPPPFCLREPLSS